MRVWCAAALILSFLTPAAISAASRPISTIHVAHPVIAPGQTETITLTARDLDGRPLVRARVSAFARYGKSRYRFHPPRTSRRGTALLLFHSTRSMRNVSVTVSAFVTNGYISIPLTARFTVRSGGARPTQTPAPTATATRTPVPTATSTSVTEPLDVLARAVPPQVTAPSPIWVVAYVHNASGTGVANADVQAVAQFAGGSEAAAGQTDGQGVALLSFDTAAIPFSQAVDVHVVASSPTDSGSSDTTAVLSVPAATATATSVPAPTSTLVPTSTPIPTATATTAPDQPTATPVPAASPTPFPTPTETPSPVPTQAPDCPGSESGCMQAMLNIMNSDRAHYAQQYGMSLAPLTLNLTDSNPPGTNGSCTMGAYGHSVAMAQTGQIWHIYPGDTNDTNPASFPNNFCVEHFPIGQNVGYANDGNELQDLNVIDTEMMSEEHDPGYCGQYSLPPNHACSIVSSKYQQVGIGIYVDAGGTTWLTEDFLGY